MKTAAIKSGGDANYGAQFLIDGVIKTGELEGNWVTDNGLTHPWIQLSLTEPLEIIGVEFSAMGHNSGSVADKFKKIDVRAGMTSTSRPHKGHSNTAINDNPIMAYYLGPAGNREVVYITFQSPVTAQYIVVQGRNIQSNLMLTEVRIIKCK